MRRIWLTCVCLSRSGHQFHFTHLFSGVFKPQLCPEALWDCASLMLWSILPVPDQLCLSPDELSRPPISLGKDACSSPGFLSAWFSGHWAVTVWITSKIRLLAHVITLRITSCWEYFLQIVCYLHLLWTVFLSNKVYTLIQTVQVCCFWVLIKGFHFYLVNLGNINEK